MLIIVSISQQKDELVDMSWSPVTCHLWTVKCHLSPITCHLHLSPVMCNRSFMTYHLPCLSYFLNYVREDCISVKASRGYETTTITRPWHKHIKTSKDCATYWLNWPRDGVVKLYIFSVQQLMKRNMEGCNWVEFAFLCPWQINVLILCLWIFWQAI